MAPPNPGKAMQALLDGLRKINLTNQDASLRSKINKIEADLNKMQGQFPAVKEWQEKLENQCTKLSRHRRELVGGGNISSTLKDIESNIKQMETLLSEFPAKSENTSTDIVTGNHIPQHQNGFPKLSELEEKIIKEAEKNQAVKNLRASYDRLDRLELKICLLFLAIFPENAVLKKRLLVYWWLGEGLIRTEEEGEQIFYDLLKLELIIPHGNGKCPTVNKCQIHPWIRYMLITVGTEEQLLHFDKGMPCFDPDSVSSRRFFFIGNRKMLSTENGSGDENLRTIFNVSEIRVRLESKWFARLNKLVVLQLGRWQIAPSHHIEVLQSKAFLRGLRAQKHLKYLSLRGISTIISIPHSIVELVSLEILDLKDCRNLETLPHDIASLRKLTHLDVSDCYLLENMPKGLDKLTNLQVLKGFIIGNSEKRPCRIVDLSKLPNLKRLSMHIGTGAFVESGEFDKLENLRSVRCLKISWGVSKKRIEQVLKESLSFPRSLEKLVLEGMPHKEMPNWLNPSKLGRLEKLYIKGGHLGSLDHDKTDSVWNLKILRLKYLNNLKRYPVQELRQMFPALEYVQKTSITHVKGKGGVTSEPPELEETIDLEWIVVTTNP